MSDICFSRAPNLHIVCNEKGLEIRLRRTGEQVERDINNDLIKGDTISRG